MGEPWYRCPACGNDKGSGDDPERVRGRSEPTMVADGAHGQAALDALEARVATLQADYDRAMGDVQRWRLLAGKLTGLSDLQLLLLMERPEAIADVRRALAQAADR